MPTGIYIRKPRLTPMKSFKNSGQFKIGSKPSNGFNMRSPRGENHPNWKGGIKINKDLRNKYEKEYRHKKGISKKYNYRTTGIKISKKTYRQHRKYLMKNAGELPISRIQMVYEDNIKQYGTLTCYLCLNEIEFGKDHLEHKTPISKGGTNLYENLAIACQRCNCKKHTKTEQEFREELKNVK